MPSAAGPRSTTTCCVSSGRSRSRRRRISSSSSHLVGLLVPSSSLGSFILLLGLHVMLSLSLASTCSRPIGSHVAVLAFLPAQTSTRIAPHVRRNTYIVGTSRTSVFAGQEGKPRDAMERSVPKKRKGKRRKVQTEEEVKEVTKNNKGGSGGNAIGTADEPKETLPGGPALIFAMARRMLVWDDKSYMGQNDTYRGDGTGRAGKPGAAGAGPSSSKPPRPAVLPRWHPHGGISDFNPSFRSSPPAMNSAGYAASIRRNSRKRNKPSRWRHALRTYDRMRSLEEEAAAAAAAANAEEKNAGTTVAAEGNGAAAAARRPRLTVRRSAPHHEAAIVACAKLGLWREAFRIYDEVAGISAAAKGKVDSFQDGTTIDGSITTQPPPPSAPSQIVTDNMVLGLVRAAVRGSKSSEMKTAHVQMRRVPLDRARDILMNLEDSHGIPVDAMHVNPLAAAYQKLGLSKDASDLIQTCLSDRETRVENVETALNVKDVQAKDRESYGILVKGGLADGDWASAVDALTQMTEAGMYPTERQMTNWNEIAEKREGRRRSKRSWKKRRDQYWLQGLQ